MKLDFDEVRRLTGANLFSPHPGAVVDVFVDGIDKALVCDTWSARMTGILEFLGWEAQDKFTRCHDKGVNLAISAPVDALYTACDAVELAWNQCEAELREDFSTQWEQPLADLRESLENEANPLLLDLIDVASQLKICWLVDDDEFSLGMGKSSQTWPVSDLPSATSIEWGSFQTIPLAFVTGTNGKSTSVRLAATVAEEAGFCAGITCTDFVRVGTTILDHGDYSGPGGARILLRHKETRIAFLELARGGLLRRGLPAQNADVALITNVAADHLGQYGINTVGELAQAKFIVAQGVKPGGTLVLNADDEELRRLAGNTLSESETHPETASESEQESELQICWFSMDKSNPLIRSNLSKKLPVVYCDNGQVVSNDGNKSYSIGIKYIALSFGGSAIYNIYNAMGVIGLCNTLDLSEVAIRQALARFGSSADDNIGRGNHYQYKGATVIVDFAHNQHSMRAVINMAKKLPAERRIVMFSHAGDRSDDEIADLTREVVQFSANRYIIAELKDYLRGRELGEVPQLAQQALLKLGIAKSDVTAASSPLEGAEVILSEVRKGDVILLFTLSQREAVHDLLSQSQGT